MTDTQRHLSRLRDNLDANVCAAVIGLMIREATAAIDGLLSRRSFGHVIDTVELLRLKTHRQELIDG